MSEWITEWITDRLPTKEDSFANQVIIAWDDGIMCMTNYKHVEECMPWTPIPKPAPYVKPEPQRWKPQEGHGYYVVRSSGIISYTVNYNHLLDEHHLKIGNCFQTREQAEEAARRINKLLQNYHKEITNGI